MKLVTSKYNFLMVRSLVVLLALFCAFPLHAKDPAVLYTGMDYVSLEYGQLPTEEDALLTIGGNVNVAPVTNVVVEAGFGDPENESGLRMRGSVLLQLQPIKRFGVSPYLLGGMSQMELGAQQCVDSEASCQPVGIRTVGLNYGIGIGMDVLRDRSLNLSWSRYNGSEDVQLNMLSMGVSFR
ncbi:MAG: porin family protein [Gammaproteobacteria bacterium]|nr:porin family protein [Gammaproteobacteria bacterium]